MEEERDLAAAARDVWDRNAVFWDAHIAEGNDFHLAVVRPAVEELLDLAGDEAVLDVGCGNGLFARRLAGLGARVVACDASGAMLERARARGDGGGLVTYRLVDATDEAAVRALGAGTFDAAVAAMVLMDIPTLAPLARGLRHVLKPDAPFVFAVSHPCFHTTGTRLVMEEEEDDDGRPVVAHAVKVRRYLSLAPARGVALQGQPESQWYFDRPLQALVRPFFDAGFVLDGLREPAVPRPQRDRGPDRLWDAHREIPPALVVRLRAGRP